MRKDLIKALSVIALAATLASCTIRPATPNEPPRQGNATTAAPANTTTTEPRETEPPVTYKTEIILEDSDPVTYEILCSHMQDNPRLELLRAEELTLTAEEYVSLCELNPNTDVITKVEFEGTVFDLSLSETDISGKIIADKPAFDTLLSHFPAGIKLVMCDCGYTDDEMGTLREKYPHVDFAWRIYLGQWNLRTDDEAFSVMIRDDSHTRLKSEDIEVLRYCTNMYALDLGHQDLTDLSVIGDMTDLRVLILADNLITDITPLSKLKNLQYLELFVNSITDLSPLAECTELVDLNFGWNRVSDLSGIYSLEKIERLWLPNTRVPAAKHAEITENFPEAKIIFDDVDSVSSGWRTHERYFTMRGMFNERKYNWDFVK